MYLIRILTIIATSACCIQIINTKDTQTVFVEKINLSDDSEKNNPVTVKITDEKGEKISEATFKYMSGSLNPFKKDLFFDWSKGDNLITAYYNNEPGKEFGIRVKKGQVRQYSPIVIGRYEGNPAKLFPYALSIGTPKTKRKEKSGTSKILTRVQVEDPNTYWLVISADRHLTKQKAKEYLLSDYGKLPSRISGMNTKNTQDKNNFYVYTKQPTKVYTLDLF